MSDLKQVVSKTRVADHGEVYTSQREVDAILDMLEYETERIDSRFLEPACGIGGFLVQIVTRKLRVVKARYVKSQLEYERNSVLAMTSVYGIDILQDNVVECRQRLFEIFDQQYTGIYKKSAKDDCRRAVRYVLSKNIIWGDALSLQTPGPTAHPIIFVEWSPVNGSMFKRREFTFRQLVVQEIGDLYRLMSDLGEDVFIPIPEKEYPLVHFLRIGDVEQERLQS